MIIFILISLKFVSKDPTDKKIIIGFGHGLVPQVTSNYPNQWWPSVTMLGLVVGHKLGPQWVKKSYNKYHLLYSHDYNPGLP